MITAETDLEERLLADPDVRAGLAWGQPRWGHPEGAVGVHVANILRLIAPGDPLRADLRLIAIVHDAGKAAVRPGERWSRDNDHAVLARRLAERYVGDERLLQAIELHDEPYWIWRDAAASSEALYPVLDRIPDVALFARFVELDASTEGKDLSFLWWFRHALALVGLLPETPAPPPDAALDEDHVLYVKTFAVTPGCQAVVADAARAMVAEHAATMNATGEVLTSEDGLRVVVLWRWRGAVADRLLRDGSVVRAALAAHPELAWAEALDARLYRT